MKKFLYPLPLAALLVFFFNCSNEGFKELKDSEIAKLARLDSLLNISSDSLLNIKDTIVKCFVGESCYEINNIACLAMGGEEKPDKECISFTCEWKSNSVEYGKESTLSFKWGNAAQEENCSVKISPLDTGKHLISASTIAGLSYSKDTTITATATLTCKGNSVVHQDCKPLTVKSIKGPEIGGTLSFVKNKVNYIHNDSNYFFIGTIVDSTYISNTIKISDKEFFGCGNIKVKIEGSPAKLGTQVRATAVVTCSVIGEHELELAGISAEVLPDPVLGNCKLIGNWEAMMFKKDTLFMSVPIENNYGRCKVQNDTLPLKNYSGKVNDLTAKVVCGATTTNKKCSEEVFVADKFAEIKTCHNPRVQIGPGITVVEITCKDGDTPAKTFGCDCSGKDTPNQADWTNNSIFTINGVKAQGGGCWATAPIPADIANKESKRVLIEYNKELGCVAY